jgi:hypothetical protein
MSRDGAVTLDFGGEPRAFRLGIGELRRLQEKCDAGPGEIARRLAPYILYGTERRAAAEAGVAVPALLPAIAAGRLGEWRIDDVRETLFLGLIGGGMAPNEAGALIRQWVDSRPLLETIPTAFEVAMAAIAGVDDEAAVGEPRAPDPAPPRSRAARSASGSRASTPPAAPPGSPRPNATP